MLSGDWGLRLSAACGGRLARCFRELPAVGPDPDRWHCAGHDQFCTAPYGIQNDAADLVRQPRPRAGAGRWPLSVSVRSEEHTSELQSLMRISYAVFCLKKKKQRKQNM